MKTKKPKFHIYFSFSGTNVCADGLKSQCRLGFLAIYFIFSACGLAAAADYTWYSSATGNWTDSGMWNSASNPTYPNVGDRAYISQGTVNANVNYALVGARNTYTIKSEVYQTGGTVTGTGELWINSSYYISGGQMLFSSGVIQSVGNGAGAVGYMEISGANTRIENTTSSNNFIIGRSGGQGVVKMLDGRMVYNEILVGQEAGTGTFELSGGTVQCSGAYTLGFINATGTATHTGGDLTAIAVLLAPVSGTATLNLFGGTINATAAAGSVRLGYSGGGTFPSGSSTLNQTGGTLNTVGSVIIGEGTTSGHYAVYNMSGGVANIGGGVTVGLMDASSVNYTNTTVEWNLSQKADVRVSGNVQIGSITYENPSAANTMTPIVNITDTALLKVQGAITGNGLDGRLNIIGSNATITGYEYNTGTGSLRTTYTMDRFGVSTIRLHNAASLNDTADLKDQFHVKMPGHFMSLQVDHLDLVSASVFANESMLSVNNTTPFDFIVTKPTEDAKRIVRLEFDPDGPSWDLIGVHRVNGDLGLEKGSLRVYGTETYLQVFFTNLTDRTLAEQLVAYLNAGMDNPGLYFQLVQDNSMLLNANYLNDDGYAYFGWDLTDFNLMHTGSAVHLLQFNEVPEPGTWAMLLLGMAGLLGLMRKQPKHE